MPHKFHLYLIIIIFFSIRPPPVLIPVLGPLEWYIMPTLDAALLISSRAGADLGRTLDRLNLINSREKISRAQVRGWK